MQGTTARYSGSGSQKEPVRITEIEDVYFDGLARTAEVEFIGKWARSEKK